MICYWFSRKDGTTRYQVTPAEDGRTDHASGKIVPCENGLHGSPTPWDALRYASGGTELWRVEIPDNAVPHGAPTDKYAAPWRTYVKHVDLEPVMRAFARVQAQQAATAALTCADKWDMPDNVRDLLTAVRDGKPYTKAAADAAADAAYAAYAAYAAADAAYAAAYAAYAAADAAYAAADAAYAAANAAAKDQFNQMALAALDT